MSSIAQLQGCSPRLAWVILGNGMPTPYRVTDYAAYYRSVKARFLERLQTDTDSTYPDPVKHCSLCEFDQQCSERRIRDDHLSLVANCTTLQRARLTAVGISTLEKLAESASTARPPKMTSATFDKLQRQAALQLQQRRASDAGMQPPFTKALLPIAPDHFGKRGLSLLPAPSAGDVFFDIEGDPYFETGKGFEYLLGVYSSDAGFKAFWGCDRTLNGKIGHRAAEKTAFEGLIDHVMRRRAQHSDMHIYHYANYEERALKE